MQATCHLCGCKHVIDDKQIGTSARVRFRCTQCGQPSEVDIGQDMNRTTVSFVKADVVPFVEPTAIGDQSGLALPSDKTIVLNVVAGKSNGVNHTLDRPRVIIGRVGADLPVDDSEVSRWHCAVEVQDHEVRLRDLDSRNGVYIGNERVKSAVLQHASEFRVGSTVFRVSITPK
jgi:hypothetical protein